MIPKIIHQTWIHQTWNSNNLPEIFQKLYEKNKESNPDFTFKLWTDNESESGVKNFLEKNYPKLFNIYSKTKYNVQKSDIARLAILHYYGGIYIDLDILLLKSLNNLLDYNKDTLFLGYEPKEQTKLIWKTDKYYCNAFIACSPKNKLISNMIDFILNIYEKHDEEIFEHFNIFGTYIFKNIIDNSYADDYEIIETKKLYPINDIKLDTLDCAINDFNMMKTGKYYNESYMVHYWIHSGFEGSKILFSYKYNDNLNIHENITEFFKLMYPNNKTILLDNKYIYTYD